MEADLPDPASPRVAVYLALNNHSWASGIMASPDPAHPACFWGPFRRKHHRLLALGGIFFL